jgi:hypothetical protein
MALLLYSLLDISFELFIINDGIVKLSLWVEVVGVEYHWIDYV